MYRMTDEEFEAAIEEALDAMPDQFLTALENVAVVWDDEPSAYHLGIDESEWDAWHEAVVSAAEQGWNAEGALAEDNLSGEVFAEDDDLLGDDLLGLFDGLSLVERASGGYDDDIPDVITVFKGPHERCFASREEIVEEIGKTVIHELGHYFGLDDDKLYEMGY